MDHAHDTELKTPVRNHYFYGKLLDVFHFDLETEYLNEKRWLLNRLVVGRGVICGLDVQIADNGQSVIVLPGVAIDRCGREIVVPKRSRAVRLPDFPPFQPPPPRQDRKGPNQREGGGHYCEEEYAHVVLCYHECEADPAPALVPQCGPAQCVASTIHERYEVQVRAGFAPKPASNFPDVIEGQRVSYNAIVDYVTRPCPALPADCCLALANIHLRGAGDHWVPEADIYVRPIVFNNRLLYNLLVALATSSAGEE